MRFNIISLGFKKQIYTMKRNSVCVSASFNSSDTTEHTNMKFDAIGNCSKMSEGKKVDDVIIKRNFYFLTEEY